jgi:hypothetical protein
VQTCGQPQEEWCGPVRAEPVFWTSFRGLPPAAIQVFATSWQEQRQDAPNCSAMLLPGGGGHENKLAAGKLRGQRIFCAINNISCN